MQLNISCKSYTRYFYKKKVYKKMRLNFQNLVFLVGLKSIFRHYCIQNAIDGIQFQVCNINNEIVDMFGQFVLVKVKKEFRKSQTLFRKKFRKLRLRQNYGFLIKKRVLNL